MSIDEAIRYYEDKNVVLTEEEALANTIAIKTMRKYQKMLQVLSDWKAMGYNENDGLYSLLSRVVEDGNND